MSNTVPNGDYARPVANAATQLESTAAPNEEAFYKMLQALPKHDTIRLRYDNFSQWKYHLQLLLDAYELTRYVDGSMISPPQQITNAKRRLISNPSYAFFVKQNKLLVSWFISTLSGDSFQRSQDRY